MSDLIPGIAHTSAALHAERLRMEVISQNIANAHTTRGADGRPYQRQQVVFESALSAALGPEGGIASPSLRGIRVEKDLRPPVLVHQPGHPDADERGMVARPNINVHEEMADLITATRAFEANLAVVKNARSIAIQTLAIGKR
jgi:flagellar basal-body rod protein FlgC